MTTLVLAVSPGHNALDETLSTLNYAKMAKRVKNRPKRNIISALKINERMKVLKDEKLVEPMCPWEGSIPIRNSISDLRKHIRPKNERTFHLPTTEWSSSILSKDCLLSKKANKLLR